jgi:hypothetical protein
LFSGRHFAALKMSERGEAILYRHLNITLV